MKYKKQIATGALAISLLVGGSSVFASSPQDIGIKNVQPTYQKQNKNEKNSNATNKANGSVVGTIGAITSTGFTVEVKDLKKKAVSEVSVTTNASTTYSKNGASATASDLAVGQKVIVSGNLDKTTNTITAKTVKIVIAVASKKTSTKANIKTNK